MAKILLLEPDKLLAQIYQQHLTSCGNQVEACPSAQMAISLADQTRPELIIIELQLIDHSGIEFLYELRSYADWQAIPAIVLTHVPPAEFSFNWQLLRDELGVKEYLYKPMSTLADLTSSINNHLVSV